MTAIKTTVTEHRRIRNGDGRDYDISTDEDGEVILTLRYSDESVAFTPAEAKAVARALSAQAKDAEPLWQENYG